MELKLGEDEHLIVLGGMLEGGHRWTRMTRVSGGLPVRTRTYEVSSSPPVL
jgi:hypothetical protein